MSLSTILVMVHYYTFCSKKESILIEDQGRN